MDKPDQRSTDKGPEHRRWRLGESTSAVIFTFMSVIFSAGILYNRIIQAEKDIDELRATQKTMWSSREGDKTTLDERLRRIEEKLDIVIGEVDGNHMPPPITSRRNP